MAHPTSLGQLVFTTFTLLLGITGFLVALFLVKSYTLNPVPPHLLLGLFTFSPFLPVFHPYIWKKYRNILKKNVLLLWNLASNSQKQGKLEAILMLGLLHPV